MNAKVIEGDCVEGVPLDVGLKAEAKREKVRATGQAGLFD